MVVECVAREGRERDRDAVVVEEEPELHDGLPAVLLADAELPQARDDVPVGVLEVAVRSRGLEEEVRHVVEHRAGVSPDCAGDAGVHAPDDLPPVRVDDVERVIDVVRVGALHERSVVLVVLAHRRPFRLGIDDPPVGQEPHDSREVVPDARGALDAREELVEPECAEDWVEDARSKTLRIADALFISAVERDRPSAHGRLADIRFELLNERLAIGEGLSQPLQVVRLAVVVLRKRTEADDGFLANHQLSVAAFHSLQRHEPYVLVVARLSFSMCSDILTFGKITG